MTSVWVALTSLKSESGEVLPASTLCLLGTALSALWTHHYRCIFDNEFWNPEACFRSFLDRHRFHVG
ncbi:hypothetical protein BD560DRAFT_395859 [Blakeslea trispora]|nr:hypothetical protein BD560DRAFT_395859 [Blakeslea trispora]